MSGDKKPIGLEEGWGTVRACVCCASQFRLSAVSPPPDPPPLARAQMQTGIEKLIRILEGEQEEQFNAEQYMNLYT